MELAKSEITVLLKHYWKKYNVPAAAQAKWKEKVSLVSVWHNDGSKDSALEKKTLNIYHVLEDLNYGILRIYAEFWKKIRKKSYLRLWDELSASTVTIDYVARLKRLENHTEAVNLYIMKFCILQHYRPYFKINKKFILLR